MLERAQKAHSLDLGLLLARSREKGSVEDGIEDDPTGYNARHTSGINLTGRIVLNLWRIIRSELALTIYSFENVVFHVLCQRCAPGMLLYWSF